MDKASSQPPYEDRCIRCPKLGHSVTFAYCRVEECSMPCRRALTCWSPLFDAETFFVNRLGPDEMRSWFGKTPPPKIVTLLDLIERARKTIPSDRQDPQS